MTRFGKPAVNAIAIAFVLFATTRAQADDVPVAAPKPAPYSVPWGLRPIVAPTVVRLDTSIARYEDRAGNAGATVATLLTASYRLDGTGPPSAGLAPFLRLAIVGDTPPTGKGDVAVVNPLLGLVYALKLDHGFRINTFFGMTVPVGTRSDARLKGPNARAQLDNALFAVNDTTFIPGVGVAWVDRGFTVQLEGTMLHLIRRGSSVQPEATKTNLTTGLHVGYFVLQRVSIGTELRYQRWLNAPFAVEKDESGASRDALTFAVGPRFHIELGALGFLRPGVSYQRALDKPLAASTPNYHVVQVDLPLFFK